jgi:hypothetical protein
MMQLGHPDYSPKYSDVAGGSGVRGIGAVAGSTGSICLLQGQEDTLNCYRLVYGDITGSRASSPRHHHTFDQIRYIMSGYAQYGDLRIPENTVIYLPETAHYGPNVVHADEPGLGLEIQFGGASGNGYPSMAQWRKGKEELPTRDGEMIDGVWVTIDENGNRHNQDGFEALWETIWHDKAHYAPPRYNDQVYMTPENFNWIEDPRFEGVARKNLGVFTERELRIGFIRVDKGASFLFGEAPAPEIVVVTKGAISWNGETHPRLTAFATTADEEPHTLTGAEDAELYYLKLPTF